MGANDKVVATFHPAPPPRYECDTCEREHADADAAHHCCDQIALGDD